MDKEIILAKNSGFCFGVKRAVDMVVKYYYTKGVKVSTLGPLIHNNDVIEHLEAHNIKDINLAQIDELSANDVIVLRSHGVTPDVIEKINETGAKVVDATCPYVSTIHKKVQKYHSLGYQIIIVGNKKHPEVIGINGWCDNSAVIVRDGNELDDVRLGQKVCIVAQTTEKADNFEQVVTAVSKRCAEVEAFNTICSATKERQQSAVEVSRQVDLMIVIGGKHSSNTKKLFEISRENCEKTILIENSAELDERIILGDAVKKIGITAGASTPDWVIQEVIHKINT
ncbi:MAG: 4-hydroxy-3-methylbut-2-enyl diphosphate reductase, partial [Firmicutes bacterium]|nr:4-hydroxy-3-methylbut-2-enyl diphosphate reductase [Bacillota bacterium]